MNLRIAFAIVTAPLLAMTVPHPALAQEAAARLAELEPYARLHAVLTDDRHGTAARQVARFTTAIIVEGDPTSRDIAKRQPQFGPALEAALLPIFTDNLARLALAYRPRYEALFRQHMTASQATALANMFESPAGQRMLNSARSNVLGGLTGQEVTSDGPVTEDMVRRDIASIRQAVLAETAAEDHAYFARLAREDPQIFGILDAMRESLVQIRIDMENEPTTEVEDAAIESALVRVYKRFGL